MKKFETISAANFEAMSKKAIDNQPLRKEVSLKTIQVLHDDVMSIDGRPVKITTGAFKDLCKIVGLPVGFDKTFTGTLGTKPVRPSSTVSRRWQPPRAAQRLVSSWHQEPVRSWVYKKIRRKS